jgi:hypothetical protein
VPWSIHGFKVRVIHPITGIHTQLDGFKKTYENGLMAIYPYAHTYTLW